MAKLLKIGGVPEHLNEPFKRAISNKWYENDADTKLEWTDYPGGSGAMLRAVESGEVDLAIVLTEAAVADCVKSGNNRIVGTYLRSPLRWGIFCSNSVEENSIENIKNKKIEKKEKIVYGISRMGSGSHLMATIDWLIRGWNGDTEFMEFKIVNSLEGAKAAMKAGSIDIFMWEYLTTKHLADRKEWKHVGDRHTPWPSFVFIGNKERLESMEKDGKFEKKNIQKIFDITKKANIAFREFGHLLVKNCENNSKNTGMSVSATKFIADNYLMSEEDAQVCLDKAICDPDCSMGASTIEDILGYLVNSQILTPTQAASVGMHDICSPLCNIDKQALPSNMYEWRLDCLKAALRKIGKTTGDLTLKDLTDLGHLDQYHYGEIDALDTALEILKVSKDDTLLDIGSGIGGPARYVATKTGCKIVCVEYQSTLNAAARELTERIGLKDRITYIDGDAVTAVLEENSFNFAVSFLTILHIPNRTQLFKNTFQSLKSGGKFLFEDYVAAHELSTEVVEELKSVVGCPYLPTEEEYKRQLASAGFTNIEFHFITAEWKTWTKQRADNFEAKKDENITSAGEHIYNTRAKFYRSVENLFVTGHVLGARITGSKA